MQIFIYQNLEKSNFDTDMLISINVLSQKYGAQGQSTIELQFLSHVFSLNNIVPAYQISNVIAFLKQQQQ